ncbi:hypothetical protein [Streptococcus minor]|uniref:hypothetical protein n=1 Tax=Streptococcus minor TaxID=229549 RepID=UPI00035FDDDE|nr:hypothetical protein [Streptococcus minor]
MKTKTITIQTIGFYAIQNEKCFAIIDEVLANVLSEQHMEMLKKHNIPSKCMEILREEGYRIGFSPAILKCFEKQVIATLSTEYFHEQIRHLFGWEKESFEIWYSNRSRAQVGL